MAISTQLSSYKVNFCGITLPIAAKLLLHVSMIDPGTISINSGFNTCNRIKLNENLKCNAFSCTLLSADSFIHNNSFQLVFLNHCLMSKKPQ